MARIIGVERGAGSVNDDPSGGGNAGMKSGSRAGGRKPSFKTRGGSGGHSRNIRATKVTLPASKVKELASKFNAVIVDGESDRTPNKKSSAPSKTSSGLASVVGPPSSAVLAAVQRFEGIIVDHHRSTKPHNERPKCILVRTNSTAQDLSHDRLRDIPEAVPEEKNKEESKDSNEGASEEIKRSEKVDIVIATLSKDDTQRITNELVTSTNVENGEFKIPYEKPKIKPKPSSLSRQRRPLSSSNHEIPYKQNYSINNNRLSLPKVAILDELLSDEDTNSSRRKPNDSFLWRPKTENSHNFSSSSDEKLNSSSSQSDLEETTNLPLVDAQRTIIAQSTPNLLVVNDPPELTNLIANKSSLYRHLGRSHDTIASLKQREDKLNLLDEIKEKIEPNGLAVTNTSENVLRSSPSGIQNEHQERSRNSAEIHKEPAIHRVAFAQLPGQIIRKEKEDTDVETKKEKLQRSSSIRSQASYEDVVIYKQYEDMEENNYADIAEYDDSEAIYDDVLNVISSAVTEGIYETIYSGEPPRKEDSDSSADHQNSLYDHRPASQASSGSGGRQSGGSKSDGSEWLDVESEDKDRKEEFILLEEKTKPKNIQDSWSQRVRRQWSHRLAEEFKKSRGEANDEMYESNVFDGSTILDDFDDSSDSEFGDKSTTTFDLIPLPASTEQSHQSGSGRESEGIYGLMMSAGKKVKKTSWSFSQRLRRRMSKISISVSESIDGGMENSYQKRWPSFKRKTKLSTSKFYLDPEPKSSQPIPAVQTNGQPPTSLPFVLPPFKESKRPSLDLPQPPSPPSTSPSITSPVSLQSLPLVLPPFHKDTHRKSPPLRPQSQYNSTPAGVDRSNLHSSESGNDSRRTSVVDSRRSSVALISGLRPTSPPPPPPPMLVNGENKPAHKSVNDPTLYVESGLFGSNQTTVSVNHSIGANQANQGANETNSNHSGSSGRSHSSSQWYSDVGLYENTTSEPDSDQDSRLNLQFADEPLYQFYAARVAELEQSENNSDIGYEEIGPNSESSGHETYSPSNVSVISSGSENIRPSALDLVNPESINRTLWCQVPQVINSGILESLSANHKRLQEAKFELITSEASYYKSLTVLERVFANSPTFKDETVIPKVDYKTLFGNVSPVRKCSEAMLAGLEKCWQDSILLDGVCDVILDVAKSKFAAYVRYCSHQVAIERTLKRLKKNTIFFDKLSALESSPACHSLSLSSFLLLPMQRITRLPLLIDAIMTKLGVDSPEYESCQATLVALNKVVHDCNEAARQTERLEEMVALSRALVFPKHLRPLPLMSASRWLVRSGQVVQFNPDNKLTFSKKLTVPRQTKLTLFLFTDLFFVTKKKSEESFSVITYCPRNFVQMNAMDDPLAIPGSNLSRFLLSITILENHNGKTQELMVCCNSESCRQRWLQPFHRPTSEDPDQVLYETWDCPQVVASHAYPSTQPDELSLQPGDVVNVLTKMADGWFYGERLRDSEKGWFPGNHVTEVMSAHVRARNLRLRHRLLALSSTLIQQRQQPKQS